jgi:hypothetical protein
MIVFRKQVTAMHDVVIYGGTPGGVIAAVSAARSGSSVLLLERTRHVGGLSVSGLNTAEREHMLQVSFGGIMLEFYQRIGAKYGKEYPLYNWESHVAERVFGEMLRDADVRVRLESTIAGVQRAGRRIESVTLTDGSTHRGRVFVDATYEGDLMAVVGVAYTFGRESRRHFDESLAGIRFVERADEVADYDGKNRTDVPIDVSPFDDDGTLLPGFVLPEGIVPGEADGKVMNYNFRVTLSDDPANSVPIGPPQGYTPARFKMVARFLAKHPETGFRDIIDIYAHPSGKYAWKHEGVERYAPLSDNDVGKGGVDRPMPVPTRKWELNNKQNALISLGHFGGQFDYPDATPARQQEIYDDHRLWNQGLLFFMGNDPASPQHLRDETRRYGLAKDEYADNGHWPYHLYVREARRMKGAYVMTQHDILERREKPDVIHVGSHWIDCHHVQRVVVDANHFRNEGRIWCKTQEPFAVPYRALVPRAEECENLLVPVALSASHVAFCALRLESTWMALGEAAGVAAGLAAREGSAVQKVDVGSVQRELADRGVKLAW